MILSSFKVRDRATLYLNTLGGDGSVAETDNDVKFLFDSLDIPLVNLETSLRNYVSLTCPSYFCLLLNATQVIF